MRIAVLSMLEPSADDPRRPAARLRVAGRELIAHQADLAEALGAERILLVADRQTAAAREADEVLSGRDIPVTGVADAPEFCRKVTAADELLLLEDGLLADPDIAMPLVSAGSGVVTLPIAEALAAGFERIDAERGWGGLMLVPGSLAEKLRDLPRDCDIASSLLRIGLMHSVPVRPMNAEAIRAHRWQRVLSAHDARGVERERLSISLEEAVGRAPGPWVAGMAVRRFGEKWLEHDTVDRTGLGIAAVLSVIAVAALFFELFWLAFAGLALAWLSGRVARILAATRRRSRIALGPRRNWGPQAQMVFDAGLFATLGLACSREPASLPQGAFTAWFVAFVAVACLRMKRALPGWLRPWLEDRFTACAIFAVGGALALVAPVAMALSTFVLLVFVVTDALGRGRPGN